MDSSQTHGYYRKHVRSVRERETERERERERERDRRKWRHLSSAEIGEEFCTFPCQNVHLSFSPLEWHWVHTFRCQKRSSFRNSSHCSFCFCKMAWQGIEGPKQTIEFPAAPSFLSSKIWIKLIPKTIGNRKRDCAWGCARVINTTWENLQIEKHKSGRRWFRSPDWFVLFDLHAGFLWWCLLPQRNLTHNLFFYFQ